MPIDPARVDAVFLDLDDTLADTARTLVPNALRRAAATMVQSGLRIDAEALHRYLVDRAAEGRGGNYFSDAVERFGGANGDSARIAEDGRTAFLRGDVGTLRLLPGARRLLRQLREHRRFLVTAGDPATQRAKLERLGLTDAFTEIRTVDSIAGDDKRATLKALLDDYSLDPKRCLCVGDRLVGEIRFGNELGMVTVWIRRGEFRRTVPANRRQRPNYVVTGPGGLCDLLQADPTR